MNPVLDLYCSNVLQVAALQNEGVRLANIINKSTEQYKFSQPLQQCNIFRSVFAEYSPPVCFLANWALRYSMTSLCNAGLGARSDDGNPCANYMHMSHFSMLPI